MTVYTKKGDQGETGLVSGRRVSKSSRGIEAIGTLDEANSGLGLVVSFIEDKKIKRQLEDIQKDLFTIGAILAGAKLRFFKTKTCRLEKEIDKMESNLPSLTNFVLPGGSKVASLLFVARAVVRRAERAVVDLSQEEPVKSQIVQYLNRLSDYLFVLARVVNQENSVKETIWQAGRR
jgi:cob(I)alamin adenosyltransferase